MLKAIICARSLSSKPSRNILQAQKFFWSATRGDNLTVIIPGKVPNLIFYARGKRDLAGRIGAAHVFVGTLKPIINENRVLQPALKLFQFLPLTNARVTAAHGAVTLRLTIRPDTPGVVIFEEHGRRRR